ncbi:hypothetical protein ACHAWF_009079 [Thalassiosira exigua]
MDLFDRPRAHDSRPRSIAECIVPGEGSLDLEKYQSYIQYEAEKSRRRITALVAASYDEEQKCKDLSSDNDSNSDDDVPPLEKMSRTKRGVMAVKEPGGERYVLQPKDSLWWKIYVNNEVLKEEQHYQNKFRQRFRLPYQNYLELVEDCKDDDHFERWHEKKTTGRPPSPIELLVLGSLRDVHRCFFHAFIDFGSTVLFGKYVNAPMNFEEAKRHMAEFEEAGLHGGCGSSDCTNVISEGCEYNLKNNHLGPKSSHTARTFSLTSNHRKRILHTTKGGPARWNDQTMVRFDQFLSGIWDGTVLRDVEFELFERDASGNIVTVKYTGGYVIVDNGYLQWSVTVPPFKVTNDEAEIRWSKWVESMRKDVEDTFGILKGRWRILKTGIRVYGVDHVDKLLDIDGLDEVWKDGILVQRSDWTGEMGKHDFEGIDEEVPNAIARLSANLDPRNYDLSGMGPGDDVLNVHPVEIDLGLDAESDAAVVASISGTRVVRELGLGFFRRKLVEHFDILWSRGEIKWPCRRGPIKITT